MEKAQQREMMYGLPVLSHAEQEELWDQAFGGQDSDDSQANTLIYDIANVAIDARPEIDYIIDCDVDHLMQDRDIDKLSPDDHEQYFRGVTLGYQFVVGCMTYVHYMRDVPDRRQMDIDEYVYSLPLYAHTLPLAYDSQKYRILDCIVGEATVNHHHHIKTPGHRSPYVAENALTFMIASPLFAAVIGEGRSQLQERKLALEPRNTGGNKELLHDEDPGAHPLIAGYDMGVEGAITLYMQSHQQIVIDESEADLLA